MTESDLQELDLLLDRLCDGTLAEDLQAATRFIELVDHDEACRRRYLDIIELHATLWNLGDESTDASSGSDAALPAKSAMAPQDDSPASGSVFPTSLGDQFFNTPGYWASGWPVAYLVATVTLVIGLTIAAVTHMPQSPQLANHAIRNVDAESQFPIPNLSPKQSIVGQITGMVDCVWSVGSGGSINRKSEIRNLKSPVSLGDKFVLRSGLLEITYKSGANVILQGPVTYEVESAAGGYLSIGRLTARLGERAKLQAASLKSSPSTPNTLLFTIKTPTAVVTDLGTEFGVEVDRDGATETYVFVGKVVVVSSGGIDEKHPEKILSAGGAAKVEAKDAPVAKAVVNANRFVRTLPPTKAPLPMDVLAHFQLGEDDQSVRDGKTVGKETVCRHRDWHYALKRHGLPRHTSDVVAPGSHWGVDFNAANGDFFSNSNWYLIPSENFILEAWACFRKVSYKNELIAYVGDSSRDGYGLFVKQGNWAFLFGGDQEMGRGEGVFVDSGVKCESGEWTHLALVCDRGYSQLWINGRRVGRTVRALPNVPSHLFMIGGNLLQVEHQLEYFDGRIDEVRLSTFISPFKPEMLLLRRDDATK